MRLLITGAFGWTAHTIVTLLAQEHSITALDLGSAQSHVDPALFSAIHLTSIEHYEQVSEAMRDVDAVVHLAVATGGGYETPEIPFNINVRGTANLFAAAAATGVDRVILMSSAAFHVPYDGVINAVDQCLQGSGGDYMYDLTKCLQEDIGRYYAQTFGISVIALRAGHIVDGQTGLDPKGRTLASLQYGRGYWICRHDLARAVQLALQYAGEGYDAFHIIGSRESHRRFDIERTESILGFVPGERFEDYSK